MTSKFLVLSEDYKDELLPSNPEEVAYVSYSKNISLDQLVDRYLMQYEKESIGKSTSPIAEKTWQQYFGSFMSEADDTEQVGADTLGGLGGPGDIGGSADPGLGLGDPGDTGAPPTEKAGPNVIPPDIDIERYTELVYGLMQNYETLIDPKATIMNRAEAYIAKNYSPRHAEKLVKFLETKFGVGFNDRAGAQKDAFAAGSFGDAGTSTVSSPSA